MHEISRIESQSLSATPKRTTGKKMFGLTGRCRIFHLRIDRGTLVSELVVERHCFTLAKRVDRGADASKCKARGAGNEFPCRQGFAQTRCDDSDRDEDDSGNDHCGSEEKRHGSQAVA